MLRESALTGLLVFVAAFALASPSLGETPDGAKVYSQNCGRCHQFRSPIEFNDARATLLGELGAGFAPLTKTLDQAAIALANEMVGGAQALLDAAIEYAKMRMQFGRAIGSFQAIKHKCADMLIDVELAKSAAYHAAQAAAENDPDTPSLASLAKACASDAYVRTAATCIQIHGGIGFTWDNDTHLWYKRAKSSEAFLGLPSYHRERLMQRWGD